MSCWVAPDVAAELWGVSVAHVMGKIERGEVPTRHEDGFVFVDVAPEGPRMPEPRRHPDDRPATYTVVTPQEYHALCDDLDDDLSHQEASEMQFDGDWHTARKAVSRMRTAPRISAA